jgi:hypothetical protein
MPTFSVYKALLLFFLWVLVVTCSLDRVEKVDRARFSFKAQQDTRTFFQNLRMIYYDREIKEGSQVIAYRFKKANADSTRLHLNPVIVLNWETNDCLLFLETTLPADTITVLVKSSKPVVLTTRTRVDVLEFCTQLYENIVAGDSIYTLSGTTLFATPEEADNFRKVMSDYYRLTRIF